MRILVAAALILIAPAARAAPICERLDAPESDVAARLARHVEALAGKIGARSHRQPEALDAAAAYVSRELERSPWKVSRQRVGTKDEYLNVVAEPGVSAADAELLVIGAHYDTVPGSPGADDNASGVAALLEIARLLAPYGNLPVRLVAFTNEEAPLGRTDERGSLVAARASRERGEKLRGMISLESIGYFSDAPGSQRHAPAFDGILPDVGNYVVFVADPASRAFLNRTLEIFRAVSAIPSEGISISSELVRDIRRSDHAPYWDNGFVALMLTDTAELRNPNYHQASDLPATLDYARLARVTLAMAAAARCLAATEAPTSSTCYGSAEKGRLEGGVALPESGPNYAPYSALGVALGRTCVHSAVSEIVTSAYAELARTRPDAAFVYGETGFCAGGAFPPHKTHQNGTSVDFMVPVRDAADRPAKLPASASNRYGYDVEFDASGKYEALRIDFDAIASHLLALEREATARGVKLRRVILAPELASHVLATKSGPDVAARIPFSKGKPWVRHDDHYHVDFLPGCKPL
jgi:penicillin-insensitive murein endopeptidase